MLVDPFHDRGVVWDTTIARWAGERKHWVHEIETPPKKVGVVVALLKLAIQRTRHLEKKGIGSYGS